MAFTGHCIVVFSEEVVGGAEADVRNLGLARSGIELEAIDEQKYQMLAKFKMTNSLSNISNDHLQIILHKFVDFHNCGLITTSVAVVGS